MSDLTFQSDLSIKMPTEAGEKSTLSINPQGDIQIIEGQSKLSAQLIRAIVNDNAAGRRLINSSVTQRDMTTMFNLILRNFRQNQLDAVNRIDPNFSGYSVYRLQAGTNSSYQKISPNFVTYKFTDTNLINNVEQRYAFTKAYNGVFETGFTEKLTITPSQTPSKQEVVIGTDVVALAGSGQIQFYVNYSRKFMGSELVEDVLDIDVRQDAAEPRQYTVDIIVQNLRGSQVSIAAVRQKAGV